MPSCAVCRRRTRRCSRGATRCRRALSPHSAHDLLSACPFTAVARLTSLTLPEQRSLAVRLDAYPCPARPAISQCEIDAWHARNPAPFDPAEYSAFLHAIGYLLPDATGSFELRTSGVDDEIASLAGPQLVCPADNARHIHI